MKLNLRILHNRKTNLLLIWILSFSTLYLVYVKVKWRLDYGWLELNDNFADNSCNCTRILQEDAEEVQRVKLLSLEKSFRNQTRISEEDYVLWASDCESFRVMRKYVPFPLSQEEAQFPIAYSIVVHHKIQSFESLLRAIYTPQNSYCVHVDRSSTPSFKKAVSAITACFHNVFVASRLEDVVYAGWSRVQADINCMRDLEQGDASWKYFINLCGQDFPMKTNLEMVRKLKSLNGKNNLETERMPQAKEVRWRKSYKVVNGNLVKTDQAKRKPPLQTPVFSGGAYIVVCRDFVRYVLSDQRAQALMEWSRDTYSPDEFLWATLQRQAAAPGSVPISHRYDVTDVNAVARLVKWLEFEGYVQGAMYPPCQGHHVRSVCVYGAGDLRWILQQPQLFANKFDAEDDFFSVYCLEKYLRHKALQQQP